MASGVLPSASLSAASRHPMRNSHFSLVRCASERQALFSRIAPVYDNLNDMLSLGQHRIWKRMAVSWSGAKSGDCVLDLCCGSGDLAFLLSEKVGPDGKVTGLDFSKEQLSFASLRQRSSSKDYNMNIEWIEGDATNLKFPDCYFDAITLGYGLRNVVDKHRAMQEMFRVLKPGAKASVLDFNKSDEVFTALIQPTAESLVIPVYETRFVVMLVGRPGFILEWMIENVVVPAATAYGLAKEYRYLKSSIQEFLTGKELERLAIETGFSTATHYEIAGGLMGNLVATR